ncbi:nucleoside hydrolase [Lichenihabitans psoromatis]|uniref:nucleoside hydrolase n=1 Tax=Lichenihabitans psoromatis TaxID=2528642 RepID=UPI001036F276|nr:nucleoside hydrolase [Lichenihabitans psoromatis]
MRRKIIIDTDPGQDDGVAILLALGSPAEIEVLGLVAVAGNVPLARTESNARKLLEVAGRTDIPVFAGCPRPMLRPLVTAEHIHGETGLDGPSFDDPTMPLQQQHGVDFIIDTLRAAADAEITLCCLGPMTDLALALVKAPDITRGIREIVLMGGAHFEGGNITPSAEFNVYVDPEAADIVLRCGCSITMLPLDVTHTVLSTEERLGRLAAIGNRCGIAAAEMLRFSERFDLARYGWSAAPLHDPNVIAYLIDPSLYTGRTINVTVELASELSRGMTIVDYWSVTDRAANVQYMRSANVDGFYDLLVERLAVLP